MGTILDTRQIQEIIPHRYPFLLVDRIVEFEAGKRIVGVKSVSVNEPFFQGHFPGMPIMPGVLIIEALAQTAAVLALRDLADREKQLSLFSTIDNAKFRRPVVPGDTLMLELTVLKARSRYCRMRGEARVDGQLAAECEIGSSLADREALFGSSRQ